MTQNNLYFPKETQTKSTNFLKQNLTCQQTLYFMLSVQLINMKEVYNQ
jgi:hypothetical protein